MPDPGNTQAIVLDDELWEKLLDRTGGAAAPCYQCGTCTAICPWGLVRGETLSIHTLIRQAQLGATGQDGELWLCTTCAQCEALCPRGVDITKVLRELRYLAWERRHTPTGLPSVLWSIYWNNNPWSQPPSRRAAWAEGLDLEPFDPQRHAILFYAGCNASYDGRAARSARALVTLLKAAGVRFGYLGEEEPCCGMEALDLGHRPYFAELADRAAQLFSEKGVTRLVTLDPHCYHAFRDHYHLRDGFTPLHASQFLAQLVEEERLAFATPFEHKVTFHDPCYLARYHGETRAPRQVLQAIPGLELVEMQHRETDTLCCGGGGGRMWMDTEPGERLADLRVQEALATGAQVLATACSFCIACLEDSLKTMNVEGLKVMDVVEIASRAWAPGSHRRDCG